MGGDVIKSTRSKHFIQTLNYFRGRLSDVDHRVGLMKAEVDEMTRDRRNNILLHGLPVQV